ncbi:ATP-binding protein [uncultured Treponema sp.]|uniref:ATP-binding protein n=1 Tax=uncultured Treponema sp. TaxID=162155 RepID=UPI00258A07EA|nr:ATP-binding protein [uncultured Treponema sp.]
MISREIYMKRIRPFINTELIKVFTGIRRSGKSVMLELVKNELKKSGVSDKNFLCINFEQFSNSELLDAKILHKRIVEFQKSADGKIYLFFDEIQEVDGWEKCINSCRVDFDCDIYITGSNAKLLSGELATYLAGRYVEFVIYPFSFAEFLEMNRQKNSQIDKSACFMTFLKTGGMPFLANFLGDDSAKNQYLMDIYNSVVLKDVVKRNNIRDVDTLERIIAYAFSNIGHIFSATSLSKYFKSEKRNISHDTILNYLKFCADAFLIYKISRYDLEGKKVLTVNEKYYCADHGLREAVFGKNTQNIDQILENIVCLELLRRNFKVFVGKKDESEIDFIAERNGVKIYVQVAYLLVSEETVRREFSVYDSIKDNFPKYVVSMDEFDFSRNGIIHRNIRDFLLGEI